ncbi:hypothetical protein [Rodentibacter caecimuris]|uniref:hypothetical protein n=1 Tax=Rodentibacter caecimuris TaxID=1796644 RepID=UPI0007512EC6|nr:hypothetical protein [Rodentibacter heylii]AOF53660.1 hypothetical protein AC062_1568 [Pasteurellaceae bacterium NI1060]
MLTEEIKQKLLNGAYGVTKNGTKVKYIGKLMGNTKYPLVFATYNKNGDYENTICYTKNFTYCLDSEFVHDIVGLWQDKPEPFNLERALTGQGIQYKEGDTDYPSHIVGKSYITDEYYLEISEGECVSITLNDLQKNYVMWKEPEKSQAQYKELPKPITEFGDLEKAWFVGSMPSCLFPAYYSSKNFNDLDVKLRLQNKQLFATEQHAQLWCDALSGKLKVAIVD